MFDILVVLDVVAFDVMAFDVAALDITVFDILQLFYLMGKVACRVDIYFAIVA